MRRWSITRQRTKSTVVIVSEIVISSGVIVVLSSVVVVTVDVVCSALVSFGEVAAAAKAEKSNYFP